jgi:hypothetical protein
VWILLINPEHADQRKPPLTKGDRQRQAGSSTSKSTTDTN